MWICETIKMFCYNVWIKSLVSSTPPSLLPCYQDRLDNMSRGRKKLNIYAVFQLQKTYSPGEHNVQ